MNYNWDWADSKSTGIGNEIYLDWYLTGLGWTIAIAVVAWIIALLLGSVLGVMRTVPNGWSRASPRSTWKFSVCSAAGAAVYLVLPGARSTAAGSAGMVQARP